MIQMRQTWPSCSPPSGLFSNVTFLEASPDRPIWKLYSPLHYFVILLLPPPPLNFSSQHYQCPKGYYIFYLFVMSPLECQLQVRICLFCLILHPQCLCHIPSVKYLTKRWKRKGELQVSNHMMRYMNGKVGDEG